MAYRRKLTEQEKKNISETFLSLCEKFGSQKRLAKKLNVTRTTISKYIHNSSFPTGKVCKRCEKYLTIKKEFLRPDIFTSGK